MNNVKDNRHNSYQTQFVVAVYLYQKKFQTFQYLSLSVIESHNMTNMRLPVFLISLIINS